MNCLQKESFHYPINNSLTNQDISIPSLTRLSMTKTNTVFQKWKQLHSSVSPLPCLHIVLWIFGVDFAGILLTEIVHQIRAWKYSFAGKHVVITGGSSGLGLEMAKQIASESATVTIIARNQTQLEKAKDEITSYCQPKGLMTPLVEIEQADICNREEIQKAINASAQTNGAVDVIICNAGMAKTGYAICFPYDA